MTTSRFKNNMTVFDYCTTYGNINGVEFSQANIDPMTGAVLSGSGNDMLLSLDHEMENKDEAYEMTYVINLVNGETCEDSYYVVFVNPFVGTNAGSPELWIHDRAGSAEASVKEYVKVVESASPYRVIYSWVVDPVSGTGAFALSETATDVYKIAANKVETVTYAFDTTNAVYKDFSGKLGPNASLDIDADGKITFVSGGNQYNADYTIPVIATVTFTDLSVVECVIPVKFVRELSE